MYSFGRLPSLFFVSTLYRDHPKEPSETPHKTETFSKNFYCPKASNSRPLIVYFHTVADVPYVGIGILFFVTSYYIPINENDEYDVLGFIYEYLISNFAANAGKKAGEFYTPHEVSLLMSEIIADHLKDRSEIKIYDPTSGSGSLLINIGSAVARKIVDRDKVKYYAQELKENTYNLTRMNLIMHGMKMGLYVAKEI